MIIYCHTNKVNGKKYVGWTLRTMNRRWLDHLISVRKGSKLYFHNAARKRYKEKHGKRLFSEQARLNISNAMKGNVPWNKGKKLRPHTEAEKETQRRIQTGKKRSPESCKRLSLGAKKGWVTKRLKAVQVAMPESTEAQQFGGNK